MARTAPQADLTNLEKGVENLNKLKWYQKPIGIIILGVIVSIITYLFTLFIKG